MDTFVYLHLHEIYSELTLMEAKNWNRITVNVPQGNRLELVFVERI